MAVVLFAFLFLSPIHASPQKEKGPPPQPSVGRDIALKVDRGGSVEIVLKGIALPGETVRFKLDKPPAHGSLSEPRRLAGDSVAYTYTHNNSKEAALDKAVFKLKTGPQNAWGRITAEIEIREPQSRLVFEPEQLDFGRVPIGETRVKNLRIRNDGGGVLRGSLKLGIPWSVEGPAEFTLAEGEARTFGIVFSPLGPEEQRARLSMDLEPENSTFIGLRGEGVYRFDVPERIVFGPSPAEATLVVPVSNLSAKSLDLAIHAPPPLLAESTLGVPAGGRADLKLSVQKKHYTEKTVELSIRDGDAVRGVRVDLPPPPALLQWAAQGDSVDLGEFPLRHTARSVLELQNRGATIAQVELRDGSGGLFLETDQPRSFELKAGESAVVRTVWRLPEQPGEFFSDLIASHGGLDHPLRLRARVLPAPAAEDPPTASTQASPSPTPDERRILTAAEREELKRRMPQEITYRLVPRGDVADAIISWTYFGNEPVDFRLERKVVERSHSGLEQSFQERLQLPTELPQPKSLVKWISVSDETNPVQRLESGAWEASVKDLEPGFHEVRIVTRAPPDAKRRDYSSFTVSVAPPPPNPLWSWFFALAGVFCLLYLLRNPIRRIFRVRLSGG